MAVDQPLCYIETIEIPALSELQGRPMSQPPIQYRLVVFHAPDDPPAIRDLFVKVTGAHPTDAMQWVARVPGTWPKTLSADQSKALLDGLYDEGVAAEAWRLDLFPDLVPPHNVHVAACLADGFRVSGLRGEPTHWVPWEKIELISAGRVDQADEFRNVSPPSWTSAVRSGMMAIFRRPAIRGRTRRADRIIRDPVGEVYIVRSEPRICFRIVENAMNYAYLGQALRPTAAENFPLFVADLCARANDATITDATKSLLRKDGLIGQQFATPQALLDYTTLSLLWSWYRRDRNAQISTDY